VTLLDPAELVTPAHLEEDEGTDVLKDPGGRQRTGSPRRSAGGAKKEEETPTIKAMA
jgi:hypothetical protein